MYKQKFHDHSYTVFGMSRLDLFHSYLILVDETWTDPTYVDLVCDGIDTISTISINGVPIYRTANQFVQYRMSIKEHLKVVSL